MKKIIIAAMLAAIATPLAAQETPKPEKDSGKRIYIIRTDEDSVLYEILRRDRSLNVNEITVPKFAVRTDDNAFVLTIGAQINPIIGVDLGNDLYGQEAAGINFIPAQIPIPRPADKKADFFINPLNAFVDLQIVGFGGTKNQITGYVKLATDGNDRNLRLDKAYIKWYGFTGGLKHSLFEDESIVPPTIDPQGPNGMVATTAYELGYESPSWHGFSAGIGIDIPTFYSSNGIYYGKDYKEWCGRSIVNEKVVDPQAYNQNVPDIPMYIEWKKSQYNRIRLSGIIRTLNYKDLLADRRRTSVGWGLSLSGNINPVEPLVFYLQATYGKGIGAYIQDLADQPLSWLPNDEKPGYMTPTPMMGWSAGMTYNFNEKWQVNLMASQARIWKAEPYAVNQAEEGDAVNDYKYGYYGAANVFYNISSFFQLGVEYLYGYRKSWDRGGASDNRIQMQFMFAI